MAQVHHRKARKDYPDNGVKKGDMYYYVSIKTGPRSSRVMRQITPFKRSQLTSSAFLGAMYDIEDALPEVKDAEMVREIIGELEQLRDETQESFDNMPEQLQYGDTGQMLEERVQGCEVAIDELETAAGNIESWEPSETDGEVDEPEHDDEDQTNDAGQTFEDVLSEARDVSIDYP